jgi:hypothetical protein
MRSTHFRMEDTDGRVKMWSLVMQLVDSDTWWNEVLSQGAQCQNSEWQ